MLCRAFLVCLASLAVHAGQVCFPGGSQDPGEDARTCALREWDEELGSHQAEWRILGELSPIYVFASNHQVRPFVGFSEPPRYEPNEAEVAGVMGYMETSSMPEAMTPRPTAVLPLVTMKRFPLVSLSGCAGTS